MDVFLKRKEVRERYEVIHVNNFVSIGLEALNPPADMGAMVGGGASGATSQGYVFYLDRKVGSTP